MVPVAPVDLDRGVAVAADRAGLLMVAPADLRLTEADRRTVIARMVIAQTVIGAARMDLRVIEAIAALTVDPADHGPTVLLDSAGRVAPVVRAVASDAGVAPVDLVASAAPVASVAAAVRWAKSSRPRSSTN